MAVKCQKCKQDIDAKDNFKIYQKKKYHVLCFKAMQQEACEKETTQNEDKQELYSYICKLYNIKEITMMIKAQIEKYYNDNLTYTGMLYTLKYFYETSENEVNSEGIGIIPYIYQEAKEFYIQKHKLSKCEFDDNYITYKKVKVKIKKDEGIHLINMEAL